MIKRKRLPDKILDSAYKRYEVEPDYFKKSDLEVEKFYESKYLTDIRDEITYYNNELDEEIYNIWQTLKWSKIYNKKKRIPIDDLLPIYGDITSSLKPIYEYCDMFMHIAEFLNVGYKDLYNKLSIKYQEQLLKEMDIKYPNRIKNENSLF